VLLFNVYHPRIGASLGRRAGGMDSLSCAVVLRSGHVHLGD
jgi:hypothetical protein